MKPLKDSLEGSARYITKVNLGHAVPSDRGAHEMSSNRTDRLVTE
jgi:hypothetical protein